MSRSISLKSEMDVDICFMFFLAKRMSRSVSLKSETDVDICFMFFFLFFQRSGCRDSCHISLKRMSTFVSCFFLLFLSISDVEIRF